jgi:predicted kinase
LTGSGKSVLARELSERTGAATINSDVVRKAIAAKPGRHYAPYGEGIYSATMTEKTYGKMAREAERLITNRKSAILDATFVRRARREQFVRLAKKHHIPLFLIHCSAPEELTQARLVEREAEGGSVSDGRWEIYLQQKEAFEPFDEIDSSARLELDTDAPLDALAAASEKFLRARLARQ